MEMGRHAKSNKTQIDDVKTLDGKASEQKVKIGISSIQGTRKSQQDRVYCEEKNDVWIACVCDGMGGLNGGERASQETVSILSQDFARFGMAEGTLEFLHNEAYKIDEAVYNLRDENGEYLEAGTTIAAVMICGAELYWMSVGDSKIYFIRKNRMLSLTREHNYQLSLDILRKRGEISDEEYKTEMVRGESLISYLGMGNLSLVDGNTEAIILEPGDLVLLCSDGLYKVLEETEILSLLQRNVTIKEKADALTGYAMKMANGSLDNTSVIILQYM